MGKREKAAIGLSVAVMLSGAAAGSVRATAFTPGDLLVTRAVGGVVDLTANPAGGTYAVPQDATGGGTTPLSTPTPLMGNGIAATLAVDEYTPAGAFVQEIMLPNVAQTTPGTGASYALTLSGTQNNEGTITLSGDGKYFTVAGYNQTAGQATLTGANGTNAANSTLVQRVVGLVSMDGSVNTTTGLTDVSSTVSIRSAYTSDGTNLWVIGGSKNPTQLGGIHYATVGSTTSTQITAPDSSAGTAVLNAYNFGSGLQLLASDIKQTNQGATPAAAAFQGIAAVGTGLPTTAADPTTTYPTQLPGFYSAATPIPPVIQGEAADGYYFKDANTLYIADNRNKTGADSTNSQYGGVQKWVKTDTDADGIPDTWEFAYNATLGNQTVTGSTTPVGAHGLSGSVDSQGNVILYATTYDGTGANTNELFSIEDPAVPNATPSFNTPTLLATSLTDSAFRGVAVVPMLALLAGDANGDNKVDLNDLNTVLNHLGVTSSLRSDGNFDGAPTIDLNDLNEVLNHLGTSQGSSASAVIAATPEPASLGILGIGLAGFLIRRRRQA